MASKRGAQPGPANSNWQGGRSIASNGYVLIKQPDHHLADVRGYVYEHRLVAEHMLGRPLVKGEQIHHVNHDKTDNRPENLMVAESHAHHLREHRKRDNGLREPGEANPEVSCACKCGAIFQKYDESGRPRDYLSGHNGVVDGWSRNWDKCRKCLSTERHHSAFGYCWRCLRRIRRDGVDVNGTNYD